jgi:protease-4
VSRALREAADDESMKAIIFRIDSPGGSALASDVVWQAVQDARKKKPVVASMSDLAASGGYYVACGADAIVAQPATLTGSIGVFVLRPMVSGLLEKLGIGFESLQRGRHADMLLSTREMSPESRARMQAEVRSVYDQFVGRVAAGRSLDAARVDELGRGRVWTGAQAKEVGLVDELGGLRKAVEIAKAKAGIEGEVALMPYPPPKPLSVQIQEALQEMSLRAGARALALPELPRLARSAAAWLEGVPERTPALIPPLAIEIH